MCAYVKIKCSKLTDLSETYKDMIYLYVLLKNNLGFNKMFYSHSKSSHVVFSEVLQRVVVDAGCGKEQSPVVVTFKALKRPV